MSDSKFCFNWNGIDYYIISPTHNSSAANQGTYAYKDANGTSIFNSVTPSGTIGGAENEVYLDNDTTTTYFQPYSSSTRAYYCHPRFLNPTYSTTSSTTTYRTVTATKTLTFSASSDCPMSSFTKTISTYRGINLNFNASNTQAISLYALNGTYAHSHSVPFTSFMTSSYNSLDACADANNTLKQTVYNARKDFTVSRSFTLSGSNQTISSYTVYCTVFMDRFTPNVRSSSDYSPKSVTWTRNSTCASQSLGAYTNNNSSSGYIGIRSSSTQWTSDIKFDISSTAFSFSSQLIRVVDETPTNISSCDGQGDIYCFYILPTSVTINYSYVESYTSSSSSVVADAGKYFELGSSLIDYTCQNKLYGYSSTYANNAHDYGYVFRRLANANYSAGTFKLRFTGISSYPPVAICYSPWLNQITGGLDFCNTCAVCGSTTYGTISIPTADCHGVADILWYYPGKNWATSDSDYITNFCANSTYETEKDRCSQYMLLSSSSKPANMGFYLYGSTIPVAVSLYYNTSTKIADYGNRYFKKLMRYIMYYSSNKATAVGSHTFKLWYRDTPTYDTGNIIINKYTSSGAASTYTLTTTGSEYTSSRYITVSADDGDYFTISGMTGTTTSGPTESVSQTVSVYISPTVSVGSYLQGLSSLPSAPSCIIAATVTAERHLAKAYLNISFNTSMCSYLTVYYNNTSKQISASGKYYFDPNVTRVSTYTHSNLSINRKYYARAYIYINGTYTYGVWTYKGSTSSSTWSGYLTDVTAYCSIGDTYGEAYVVASDYDTTLISAPTVRTCTDAGSWKRYITVYNPNSVALDLYYTSNKTTSKTSANSGWSYYGSLGALTTSGTIIINDQSGYSDEWIIVGFNIGSSYYRCNTIDEDVTSGTPNCVNSGWYYSK